MTTTTTLIVQGHAFSYKATVNDEVVVEATFEPDEAGLHVHPLSSILLDGPNTIRVGGTPAEPDAQLHLVLASKQLGGQPRALLENTVTESFGVSTSLDLAPGDGLPRAAALGANTQHAKGVVMDLHQAAEQHDAPKLAELLRHAAEFWSRRDGTEPTWEGSDYLGHLKRAIEDANYRLRPLTDLAFSPAAGGRLQIPLQGACSALTFEHAEHPEATFEFQVALAPTPDGWVVVR